MALFLFRRRSNPRETELQQQLEQERTRRERAETAVMEIARARITEPIAGPPSPLLPPPPGVNAYALDQPIIWSTPQPPTRRPRALVNVQTLRDLAATNDLIRGCILHLQREVGTVPIKFVPRDEGQSKRSARAKLRSERAIKEAMAFFSIPGGLGGIGRRREQFEEAMIEDLLVIGAPAFYYRPRRDGKPYEILNIDASTIRPRLDAYGWPGPTDHVYEQWIYGVQVAAFTREEMRYDGIHALSYSPYFTSAVEMCLMPATTFIAEDDWNRKWLTDGTSTGEKWAVPDGWTPEMIQRWSDIYRDMYEGNSRGRQQPLWMPSGFRQVQPNTRKEHDFQSLEDWLLHRIASIFGVQPASLGYPGKAYKVSQDASYDQTSAFGVGQILSFRKSTYDHFLTILGYPELECQNVTAQEEKAMERAQRLAMLVAGGVMTPNEARAAEGSEPDPDGDVLLVPNTMTTLDLVVNPPAPVMEEGAPGGANGTSGKPPASNGSARPSHSGGNSDSRGRTSASRSGGANANSRERALSLWRAKALKRMKEGKPARCSFETEALPIALSESIERALGLAETRDEVRRIFDDLPLPQTEAPRGHVAPIYVVTHAATRFTGGVNADDRITGWLDPSLTPAGLIEARNFGRGLKNLGIERIYTSDLLRASQTAAQIRTVIGVGPATSERNLRPWNLGEYQGRLTANVLTDLLSYTREGEKRVPGGESFDTWKERLLTFVSAVMEEQETGGRGAVLLLTHSRCLELIRAWLLGSASGDLLEDVHFSMDAVPRGGTLQIVLGPAGWQSSAWEPALTSATVPAPHDPRRESIFDEVRVRWRPAHEGD